MLKKNKRNANQTTSKALIGFEFEKPVSELEGKIRELKEFSVKEGIDMSSEIKSLEEKLVSKKCDVYNNLTPWQRIQIARHPNRPYTLDYINMIMDDFRELHGDRRFAEDPAIVAGMAVIDGRRIMVIGHQKGRDVKERTFRRFGMPNPEGYRKAIRIMKLAERFNIPIITFIDTPGAFPGVGAEERGQAESIASNLEEMSLLTVPVIAIVIGEGGSGGALGIGVGNRVLILEYAYYSVISPEGCAAILWKDGGKASLAADALKLTGNDLLKLGVVDDIVPEPMGGAHNDVEQMALNLHKAIIKELDSFEGMSKEEIVNSRYDRFRKLGVVNEV
ncbi:MAG: acetyl-CoA carboxylase carboxyltransferase subunit alpha [Candidatus Auribacterota bacterium]|jgi:acetyl-CoA carboxylase carboxyl transferase subunit alpha|nr:acetyl-CoA carboxylase carboxyltransferase subunit alpha [Candidatus Auribacterota bacterium]